MICSFGRSVRTHLVFCLNLCCLYLWWLEYPPALTDMCFCFFWQGWHSYRWPLVFGCLFPVFFPLVFFSNFYFSVTFLSLSYMALSISVGSSWHFSFSPSLFLPFLRKCCALPRACVCGRSTRAILETEFGCGCNQEQCSRSLCLLLY